MKKLFVKLVSVTLVFVLTLICFSACTIFGNDEVEIEGLSWQEKWDVLVTEKGAKTICIREVWIASSIIYNDRIADDSKNAEIVGLFSGLSFEKIEEDYMIGINHEYKVCFSLYEGRADEKGNMKKAEYDMLETKGIVAYVDKEGYVRIGVNVNGLQADEWHKSSTPIDMEKFLEYYNQSAEIKIVAD